MSRTLRRTPALALLAALLAVASLLAAAVPAAARDGAHRRGGMLLAADPAAAVVHAYALPGLRPTGRLDGVVLGAHAGAVTLPDGRVLFVDERAGEVLAVAADRRDAPEIVGRAAIPALDGQPFRAGWAAVDPSGRYYTVASLYEGGRQTATVVDLASWAVGQVTVDLNPTAQGGYDELHVFLAGRPLQLVVTVGGAFRSYRLADVLAGPGAAQVATAPVGAGTHGPVVTPDGTRVYSTTADGIDGVRVGRGDLRDPVSIPYSPRVDVVQNFRPRLAADGNTVIGAIAEDEQLPPERWAETTNLFHSADLAAQRSRLTALADGIVSRAGLAGTTAAFTLLGGDGDALLVVDADPASRTFGEVLHDVALAPLAAGPQPGVPAAGTERRAAAVAQGGRLAFASAGGEGRIDVIDTRRGSVTGSITTPTALTGGGYLVAVEPGTPLVDLAAR